MYKIDIYDNEYTMPENETDCWNMQCAGCAMTPTGGKRYYTCVKKNH